MQRLTAKRIGMALGALLGLLVICAHAQRANVLWVANSGDSCARYLEDRL